MRVVVGIVTYNTSIETLGLAIASINASECRRDLEIKVLCNSPNKKYQQDVASLCEHNGCQSLLYRKNRGFGAGHNEIVSESDCDWYICCNPDIEADAACISRLLDFGEKHKGAILLAPKILNHDGSVQTNVREFVTLRNWLRRQIWRIFSKGSKPYEERFDYTKSQRAEFISGCFFAIRRIHYQLLNGFDESFFLYFEDADLCLRSSAIGYNYFIADAIVVHKWQKAWSRSFRAMFIQGKAMQHYFKKHIGLRAGRLPQKIMTKNGHL